MRRTELLQEVRKMRFEEAYGGWQERRLTQEEEARLLGVCERTFRRYVDRYEEEGLDGLVDKRLGQVSGRRAPVDEVMRTEALYRERYEGWNVKHFYSFYRREHGGERSDTWVKRTLQRAGLVAKAPGHGQPSDPSPQSGQLMCYKTGQFYLLLTARERPVNRRQFPPASRSRLHRRDFVAFPASRASDRTGSY